MDNLEGIVSQLDVFRGLGSRHLALITGCAANVRYASGEFLGRLGAQADRFWVIREGRVALQLEVPRQHAVTIDTLSHGEVVGFSWLLPPYRLQFDIKALDPTRALLFDGECLRKKCEVDTTLGYELVKRFAGIMVDRIQTMSMQLLDVYGDRPIEQD